MKIWKIGPCMDTNKKQRWDTGQKQYWKRKECISEKDNFFFLKGRGEGRGLQEGNGIEGGKNRTSTERKYSIAYSPLYQSPPISLRLILGYFYC